MYNRYVQADHGTYQRIPIPEPQTPPHRQEEERKENRSQQEQGSNKEQGNNREHSFLNGIFDKILNTFDLGHIDSGDILLLLLLFFLFEEKADEELLIALGLLLIL